MAFNLYDTHTLLEVQEHLDPMPSFWLDLAFGQEMRFESEWIDLEKIEGNRSLAPLAIPTAEGVPIYTRAAEAKRFRSAYLKPKDPVTPDRAIKRRPGEALGGSASMQAREDAIIADILGTHRGAIERRWEVMAARAILDARITLVGEDYPETIVDFQRDPSHTVSLAAGAGWNEAGAAIKANLNAWREKVRRAKFGGVTNTLVLGKNVVNPFLNNEEVRELLDTQIRGTDGNVFNIGLRNGEEVEYIGQFAGGLRVVAYSGYYEDEKGDQVDVMDPDSISLVGPGVRGVRCFGAIMDRKAGFQPASMFPKMWEQEDPAGLWIMTQSAPLMVPMRPNNTLTAKVINN
ncbi:major capsid protein [Billgrantia desiderata]|uniref:major capsid protein n=1 Tax=Billgrantia desiderata TaxID=52021 RepID=UPI001F181266|nr:major capsid protein [Halomonas desiderata]MCE8012885.1 major capsid protein [Halomonas desiderata]